jgi:hypothetical protein
LSINIQIGDNSIVDRYLKYLTLSNLRRPCKILLVDDEDSYGHDKELFSWKNLEVQQAHDLIFVFSKENHNLTRTTQPKNVYFISPGVTQNFESFDICYPEWMESTVCIYKNLPDVISQIDPYSRREFMFDALLGNSSDSRIFLFNSLKELKDQIILTFSLDENGRQLKRDDYFMYEPGCQILKPHLDDPNGHHTCQWVEYKGQIGLLSQIINVDIYQKSAYTVIAETNTMESHTFFTEKIAKPMIARRLFLVLANPGYLNDLKKLGFQTFDGIIDESYDQITDTESRIIAIVDQIRYLCTQDQQEIFKKIKPIVEHNYNLIMHTNWLEHAGNSINQIIKNKFSKF